MNFLNSELSHRNDSAVGTTEVNSLYNGSKTSIIQLLTTSRATVMLVVSGTCSQPLDFLVQLHKGSDTLILQQGMANPLT